MGVALFLEKLKLIFRCFSLTPYQSATFISLFVLICALHDRIKYEINTLNSVSCLDQFTIVFSVTGSNMWTINLNSFAKIGKCSTCTLLGNSPKRMFHCVNYMPLMIRVFIRTLREPEGWGSFSSTLLLIWLMIFSNLCLEIPAFLPGASLPFFGILWVLRCLWGNSSTECETTRRHFMRQLVDTFILRQLTSKWSLIIIFNELIGNFKTVYLH